MSDKAIPPPQDLYKGSQQETVDLLAHIDWWEVDADNPYVDLGQGFQSWRYKPQCCGLALADTWKL